MENDFFSKKSVNKLIDIYNENKIVDKNWVSQLINHLKKRTISDEEFEIIKANFDDNDLLFFLKDNVAFQSYYEQIKPVFEKNNIEGPSSFNNKYETNSSSSSSNFGIYLLLLINTAILVFFLIKYLEFQEKMSELQNNMNNLIH